ncbi:hypothetical protein KQX54_012202 [Cotesia glomerata]|uniref:Uncharacterized protein n=1 Tax=Cotesia glomerata TaxID=32391 RepID=A0AAV7ID60_COTGL|nr:hypothetical protein KQX54_012202 [Cotesia glomerata]
MAKRSFYENFQADEGVEEHRFIPSWERFDFLLTTSYKLNDSHSKSIIVGLKLDSDVYKFEPCVAIDDEKACGILCASAEWLKFTTVLKKLARNLNLIESQYKKLPLDTTSLDGYGRGRKVTMKENTLQAIYGFEELVNARLNYLQKFVEPCNVCLNHLFTPVQEFLPKLLGNIELPEEVIRKCVISNLKNNTVKDSVISELSVKEGKSYEWFIENYIDIVTYELMLLFDKEIIAKVKNV